MDPLTDAVLDTVALVRALEDELPEAAGRLFREAERGQARLFLPEIALAEFVDIALRGRIRVPNARAVVHETIDQIQASGYLVLSSLSPDAWDVFLDLDVPELHDRMVAADAVRRQLPVVTNDPAFAAVPGLRTIWK